MTFSVNCFVADPNDDIRSLDWSYSNADGVYSDTHMLATPAGDFSLSEVTQTTLVSWLEDQLEYVAAELDEFIASAKARAEYNASLKKYELEADNTYAVLADSLY